MADVSQEEITQLLKLWSSGDRPALDRLVKIVYPELHTIAARCLARERHGHTLQCTALVNEAYLRLVKQPEKDWQDRTHFLPCRRASSDRYWWIMRALEAG